MMKMFEKKLNRYSHLIADKVAHRVEVSIVEDHLQLTAVHHLFQLSGDISAIWGIVVVIAAAHCPPFALITKTYVNYPLKVGPIEVVSQVVVDD